MKNRNLSHTDDWATPPDFLEKIRKEFGEFFDPCPWHHDLQTWDGLDREWESINFINPPYNRTDKAAFVKKAEQEAFEGKKCILLLPNSTSTNLFHDHILAWAPVIRFIRGRLRFIGTNDKGQFVNYDQIQTVTKETIEYIDPDKGIIEIPKYVKQSGQHDSLLIIL